MHNEELQLDTQDRFHSPVLSKLKLSIIALIALVATGVFGFYVGQKSLVIKQQQEQPVPTVLVPTITQQRNLDPNAPQEHALYLGVYERKDVLFIRTGKRKSRTRKMESLT